MVDALKIHILNLVNTHRHHIKTANSTQSMEALFDKVDLGILGIIEGGRPKVQLGNKMTYSNCSVQNR